MNREILFRGKRTDNGKWVEGFWAILPTDSGEPEYTIIEPVDDDICLWHRPPVDPATVGQYTGLKDRNGKRIFEGDIVRADDYIFSLKYGKCGGTPNAETYGYMGFYLEAVSEGTKLCAHYGLRDDMCYFTDIKVIGNIHDNPELLKGGVQE